MRTVLDTTVLVDLLRHDRGAVAFVGALDLTPACSEITRIEIMQGLRSSERQGAERLFGALGWVAVDEPIARRAGELGRRWRASHPGIGAADLAVAATVEHANASLATSNVRHFPMFPGLRAPY